MSLGKRLRREREKRKWSQIEVAKKIGITNAVLSNYERDVRDPDTEILKKFADLYEVSSDYLLGRTKEEHLFSQDDKFDSLEEINNMLKEYKIEGFGMFNIDEWKHLTREDVLELKKHFEWVAHKARERNEEDTE